MRVPTPEIDRLMDKVTPEPNSGCWLWLGGINASGYGIFRGSRQGLAHRAAYEMHREEIPDGMHIDHLCRVRCCVNPDHLDVVTPEENYRRGEAAFFHRDKTHCKHGHPYSEDNTYRSPGGKRHCRECYRIGKRGRHRLRIMERIANGENIRRGPSKR